MNSELTEREREVLAKTTSSVTPTQLVRLLNLDFSQSPPAYVPCEWCPAHPDTTGTKKLLRVFPKYSVRATSVLGRLVLKGYFTTHPRPKNRGFVYIRTQKQPT